jgi:hypothetical protein
MDFRTVFEKSFTPLQRVYGVTLDPDVLAMYGKVLKRLQPEQLAKACLHVLEQFKPTSACPFPTPAHFIEYAQGQAEDRAAQAVARIIEASKRVGPNRSVSFGDKALHRTIQRFGGWEEMRDFDWQFRETNFKKAYQAEAAAGDNFGPDYLEGCYEKQNNLTRHSWTRGKEQPLLIVHVGDHGEPAKELPPPSQEAPKALEKPASPEDAMGAIGDIVKRLAAGGAA